METQWLDDFLKLAEEENFSRAAEARNSSQPAFSRRIRALEDWVGTQLVDRDTHRIALTEAGAAFKAVAEEISRRLALGRDQAREIGGAATSELRFASTHALAGTFFAPWFREFEREREFGTVTLIADNMVACERYMLEGRADFLLCHDHPAASNRLDPSGFTSAHLGEDILLPVSACDAEGAPIYRIDNEGRASIPYLEFEDRSGMGRILHASKVTNRTSSPLKPVFRSHLASALLSMACDGRGVAWLPLSLVQADLASGKVIAAGDESWNVPIEIRLVRPRARRNAAAETFWTAVRNRERAQPV